MTYTVVIHTISPVVCERKPCMNTLSKDIYMLHTFLELDILTACFYFDVGQTKNYNFSFFYFLRYARKFSPLFLSTQNQIQYIERSKKYMTSQGP